jgi:hypothetical protein
MFDKHMIVEDSLWSTPAGVEFGARLPYYRGLGLSMVEDLIVRVNGERIPAEHITLSVHGNTYRLTSLPTIVDDRWEMGEIATVGVELQEPLGQGEHLIELREVLRISYMPVPGGGADAKTLTLNSASTQTSRRDT